MSSKSKEKKEKKSSKKDKSSKKEKKSKKSKTDASREGSSSTPSPKLGRDPTGQCYLPSIKEWLASKSNSEHIEYVKTDKDEKRFLFTIGSDKLKFEVTYPVDADDVWSVSSDDLTEDWVNETLENVLGAKKIEEVLLYATQQFSALSGSDEGSGSDKGSDDEENEDEDGWEDEMFSKVDTKAPKKNYTPDPVIDTSKFHIPSGYEAGAVQSIIQQYREILKTDRAERGYDAAPLANNIAQWEIKLFGIAKDEPLYKDMQQQGLDHITLHVTFPPNFPFGPPFIRVVRPRFAFRTGHVTMGGSICTLVLTNDGWVATYRLDQVLVDIRAMLTSGGGRLDMGNRSDYTEDEAMVAFRRMLDTHGWKHWKY